MEELSKQYPDVMIDVESTGLIPNLAAIIQIGGVPFNYHTGEIDAANMFKRSLHMPMNRAWTNNTQNFWMVDNRDVYFKIMETAQPPENVLRDFHGWAIKRGDVRWWSKGFFDWAIIESHFNDLNLDMPFNFRQAKDMRSFIAGLSGNPIYNDPEVDKVGSHHDALDDCLTQLRQLFKVKETTCQNLIQ